MTSVASVSTYIEDVRSRYASGHAREHAYRGSLQALFESLGDVQAINDPKQSEYGAPDLPSLAAGVAYRRLAGEERSSKL